MRGAPIPPNGAAQKRHRGPRGTRRNTSRLRRWFGCPTVRKAFQKASSWSSMPFGRVLLIAQAHPTFGSLRPPGSGRVPARPAVGPGGRLKLRVHVLTSMRPRCWMSGTGIRQDGGADSSDGGRHRLLNWAILARPPDLARVKREEPVVASDREKRQAIEQHWAASEAGDVELEHRLYAEDAILDYPQSGERFVGRSTIAEQRSANPAAAPLHRAAGARHRFAVGERVRHHLRRRADELREHHGVRW